MKINKVIKIIKTPFFIIVCFLFFSFDIVFAAAPSTAEWKKFLDNYSGNFVFKLDSDRDSFSDDFEIEKGFSPFSTSTQRIDKIDFDKDGLNDALEIQIGSDPTEKDSDGDSFIDGEEFDNAFSPISSSSVRLSRKIIIYLKDQKMDYLIDSRIWKTFSVSTGKPSMPTPVGEYKIANKIKKAWSSSYGLFMPYWMGLGRGGIGIHELPVWPNGYREGEDHLGKAVSHGCIRLGVGAAQYLYSKVDINTPVIIK